MWLRADNHSGVRHLQEISKEPHDFLQARCFDRGYSVRCRAATGAGPTREHAMPDAYYLKIGSGRSQLTGTSRDPHHVGWIKLTAFYLGEPNRGAGSGGGAGKAAFTELSVSKTVDHLSPHLMLASHNGSYFDSAVLEIADARTGRPRLRVNLTDILIKTHSSPDGQTETFTIDFGNIEYNHNPIADDELEEMLQYMFKSIGLGPTVSRGARP
jgi:type VI secretion system secreted protein Hcp